MSDLLKSVTEFAKRTIMDKGSLTWMIHGESTKNNQGYAIVAPWRDKAEKQKIYNTLRVFNVAREIDHYVVCSEAWIVMGMDRKDIPSDLSTHPDREEVLIIVEVMRKNEKRLGRVKTYVMRRNEAGKVTSFEDISERGGEHGGDLFDLIPPQTPSHDKVVLAQEMWKIGQDRGYLAKFQTVLHPIQGGNDTVH